MIVTVRKLRTMLHGCALTCVQYVTSRSITLPAKQKSRNCDTRVQIGMNRSFTMGTTPCPSRGYVPSGPKTKGLEHRSRSWSLDKSGSIWVESLDHLDRLWVLGVDLEF